MKKVKIDLFTVLWFIFIIYYENSIIIPFLLAITLHELGHILMSLFFEVRINRIYISVLGARLEIGGHISYFQEIMIALAGPAFGILGFLLTLKPAAYSQSLTNFSVISLALSLFNLFPIDILDGGRITKCLLCLLFSLEKAEKIMQIISFFILFFFWLISVYLMIKLSGGLSSFVFCAIFFLKCFIFDAKSEI